MHEFAASVKFLDLNKLIHKYALCAHVYNVWEIKGNQVLYTTNNSEMVYNLSSRKSRRILL